MHSDINLGPIQVVYGGVDFGNMATKYGDYDQVWQTRQKLIDMFPGKRIVKILAKGRDGLVDTNDLKNQRQWTEVACDILISEDPKLCLAIFPSDCVPLIIYSTKTNLKAIVHCGHKGIRLGIVDKSMDYILNQLKYHTSDLRFYIGPAIDQKSYFFSDIDEHQKKSEKWKPYIKFIDGNFHIDLVGYVVSELLKIGISKDQIINSGINSYDKQYFSHRRSVLTGEPEGRNLLAVASN